MSEAHAHKIMHSTEVVAAVKERREKLQKFLPTIEAEARQAREFAKVADERLAAIRGALAELDLFLEQTSFAPPIAHSDTNEAQTESQHGTHLPQRTGNMNIVLRAKQLLSDGIARRTLTIYEALLQQGVVFTAVNPVQRISQLLSENEWFVSDRLVGWSLKGESPGGAGLSGATQSLAEPHVGGLTNEKGDNNAS
ncbi:MAG: hypothetical protein V4505_12960 [Pseudomonadota bacterium]